MWMNKYVACLGSGTLAGLVPAGASTSPGQIPRDLHDVELGELGLLDVLDLSTDLTDDPVAGHHGGDGLEAATRQAGDQGAGVVGLVGLDRGGLDPAVGLSLDALVHGQPLV